MLCLALPFGLMRGDAVELPPLQCACAGVPDTLMLGDGAMDTTDCAASVIISSPTVTVSIGCKFPCFSDSALLFCCTSRAAAPTNAAFRGNSSSDALSHDSYAIWLARGDKDT